LSCYCYCSIENHRWQSHQNHDVYNSNDDNVNHNLNDNKEPVITVANSEISETSYICNGILEEPVYYEMAGMTMMNLSYMRMMGVWTLMK